ncbi:PAS domain S-box protein [Rhodoferax sp.]|uniref:PAS domain S-box protein n=1 Tax=Rhodoferax sp. TaxID=50421 RepID=UPI00272FAB5E|nr:PAS domain S-box protein [Rhodoferax sp.]MDP2441333.1 PAS domain S-box protein [Rhodoferax sp.]MDZ4207194.1 PAS domain S-box protein [Rhodoferax sp.]
MKIIPKTLTWLAVALLLVAGGIAFMFWSYQQISDAAIQRQQTRNVIGMANDLLSGLKDAETGQRGYALTGNESYLQPYLAARDQVIPDLNALRKEVGTATARASLDSLSPLIEAKMVDLAAAIALSRVGDQNAVRLLMEAGTGEQLMGQIRSAMDSFILAQATDRLRNEASFDAAMRRLLLTLFVVAALALLFALNFAYLIYQRSQQRVKSLVHLETLHLLQAQETSNTLLAQANHRLQEGEQRLWVTLNSIGDGVITTDAAACITLLNPVAEALTGWTQAQALGKPVGEVFHIVNKDSRTLATIPVAEALAHGTVQNLVNHTVLISRDAREFDIADSCAPIRAFDGLVVGAVLVFRNISEEYAAQQALRDSAALVQTILNTVVDGLVTIHAQGGIIETVNPAIELMFGYSAAELGGKHLSLLIPELDEDHHNGSLAYYGVSAEDRANGLGREVLGRRHNGSIFPLEISVSEMTLRGQRYFTGILRDISARKAAEEAFRKAGALQKAIFDSANFSSIATDAKGVIQIFNVGAERMLGYTAAEVMNKITPADISDPQEVIARARSLSVELDRNISPGFEALVFKATRGIEDIYELTYIRKDGSRFAAVVSVTALRDAQQNIIGYLLIGTDNTARKQVEAERARLDLVLQNKNVELERARRLADHANQAKSDFLSSMSHELRSPLNAILGFAQLLESGTPAPSGTQAASVGQILKAGWYLLELINEILDLALIESGRLSLSLEPTSLQDVLQDCEAMIAPLAEQKGVRIKFAPVDHACFVLADRTRLKQVLVNLLSNAIKYNRPGGTAELTYQLYAPGRLRISVRDSGEGLSAAKMEQLFQPFNRLGQETGAEEGTGIGLVVSRRLVELMDGEIGVTSSVGVGSVFWFELDAASEPKLAFDAQTVVDLPAPLALSDGQVHTVLYVEDNKANMALVEQLVARRADLRLLGAEDAMRGIAMARAHQPDVIVMDINLPGINGMQALAILQDDSATRHIPVLALSANAMPRDIEKGMAAGFFRYLTKPIRVPEFMAALDEGLALAETHEP